MTGEKSHHKKLRGLLESWRHETHQLESMRAKVEKDRRIDARLQDLKTKQHLVLSQLGAADDRGGRCGRPTGGLDHVTAVFAREVEAAAQAAPELLETLEMVRLGSCQWTIHNQGV